MAGKTKGNQKVSGPKHFQTQNRMVQSPGHRALSFVARTVLQELCAQYNGRNNGDLSATRTMAEEWGIGSDNTLRKALKELESAGWIIQTRSSLFSRHGARCALYALGWLPINECEGKGLEVAPTKAPPRQMTELMACV